jgi:hypothetical protein
VEGGAAKTGPRSTKPWQDPDLWTCPVNPHLMYIWCNIYLFIYLHGKRTAFQVAAPAG